MIIDARNKLKPKDMMTFLSELQAEDLVDIIIEPISTAMTFKSSEILAFFTNPETITLIESDDYEITFISGDNKLIISGLDYRWWTAPVRNKPLARIPKLFDQQETETKEKVKKEKVVEQFNVALAVMTDNGLEDLQVFTGSKKETIYFVNATYNKLQVKYFFKSEILIYMNYKDEEELLNLDNWKTFDKLVEEGVFVV